MESSPSSPELEATQQIPGDLDSDSSTEMPTPGAPGGQKQGPYSSMGGGPAAAVAAPERREERNTRLAAGAAEATAAPKAGPTAAAMGGSGRKRRGLLGVLSDRRAGGGDTPESTPERYAVAGVGMAHGMAIVAPDQEDSSFEELAASASQSIRAGSSIGGRSPAVETPPPGESPLCIIWRYRSIVIMSIYGN